MNPNFQRAGVVAAVLLASSAAQAQSSITIFGTVDATVQSARGDGNGHVTRMVEGGLTSNRVGFRGVEDLGGGMSAAFHLEAGINIDRGEGAATNTNNQASGTGAAVAGTQGLTFNRRSTVSLVGNLGEVRLGRDYTPSFWNTTLYDPFGTRGVASANNLNLGKGVFAAPTNDRASNSIGYFLPANLGGLFGQVMYAMGEHPSNQTTTGVGVTPGAISSDKDGNYFGARLGYASGPISVALAAGRTSSARVQTAVAPFAATLGDYSAWNVGGSYEIGGAKVMAQFQQERRDLLLAPGTAAEGRANSWLIGASVPLGAAGLIRASYTHVSQNVAAGNNAANQIGVGYVHNLSKRTALYTTYARVDNKRGTLYNNGRATTVSGGRTSGLDIGLRHLF